MSFLMPTVVRPAVGLCGTYVAVGSSNEEKALSGITQVIKFLEQLIKFMLNCRFLYVWKYIPLEMCFFWFVPVQIKNQKLCLC